MHPEGHCTFGDLGADAAHAEDCECFSMEFDALEIFSVPFSALHAGIGLWNVACDGDEE